MRTLAFILSMAAACATIVAARAPEARQDRRMEALLAELGDPKITDWAAHEIRIVGQRDPHRRSRIAPRVCQLLKRPETDEIWKNAVRLAGSLQMAEAVPLLAEGMPRGPMGKQPDGFYDADRLNDDIVARSLAQIGRPAIPAVTSLLRDADVRMRRRAVRILAYMNSRQACGALAGHLAHESDPQLRVLIQRYLSRSLSR